MTKEEVIAKINEKLAEEFEIDPELIVLEAPLMETLELDSLDLVDMVVLIEQNFGFTVNARDFANIKSFEDFYNMILTRLNDGK